MAVGGFERAMGASKSFAILTGLLLAGCTPGDYQIVNFDVFQNGGMVQSNWRSRTHFSIPFTIAPARPTYVGEFMAVKITGKNFFGMSAPNGAYLVPQDKTDRDIPIARQKAPGLPDVTAAVGDAKAVGNPLIRDSAY